MFRDGLATLSQRHGIPLRHLNRAGADADGSCFEDDADNKKGAAFCSAALRAGVYFHPKHNMFLSVVAHTKADIARALEAAELSSAAVKRMVLNLGGLWHYR